MTIEDKEDLKFKIDQEGFDYAFREYSSFEEIKDPKFHQLRKEYVAIAKALEDYIENPNKDIDCGN